jgi:hypothetical protein
VELVSPPDERRNTLGESEEPMGDVFVAAETPWAVDGFGDIRDDPVPPPTYLVPEGPEAS